MLTVTLKPEIETRIREQIAAGRYASIEQAIEDAFVALDERERLQWLRESAIAAIDQIDRGESIVYRPEDREQRWERALERFEAGETPKPDVCP